jgi:hypothetical protein
LVAKLAQKLVLEAHTRSVLDPEPRQKSAEEEELLVVDRSLALGLLAAVRSLAPGSLAVVHSLEKWVEVLERCLKSVLGVEAHTKSVLDPEPR